MQSILISSTFELSFSVQALILTHTLNIAHHLRLWWQDKKRTEQQTRGLSEKSPYQFHRFMRDLPNWSFCVFFWLLVWPDEGAKRFQDHSEDAGGQPVVPFVLGISELHRRHRAGGKPGDDQTHCSRDRRQGPVLFYKLIWLIDQSIGCCNFLKQKCQTFCSVSLNLMMCFPSLSFMMSKSLGFGLLFVQNKQFEDVTLGFGKFVWEFCSFFGKL